MIENGRFTIKVDRALPMGGRTVNLTTPYSLEMRGDSAISYLPYFGRAYSLPYGGGDGMRFEESITDYQSTFDKKGTARIKFVARTKEDTSVSICKYFQNGSAIISRNRRLIGRISHTRENWLRRRRIEQTPLPRISF